jgi:aspartate/methionine/tyrosine aminotransferase
MEYTWPQGSCGTGRQAADDQRRFGVIADPTENVIVTAGRSMR